MKLNLNFIFKQKEKWEPGENKCSLRMSLPLLLWGYDIFCSSQLDLFWQENSDMLNACRTLAVKEASLGLSLKAELVMIGYLIVSDIRFGYRIFS